MTDEGVASAARYRRSAAGRASRLRERQNGKKLASNARYRANHREELTAQAGREAAATPMGLLSRALRKMVKGEHWNPTSFPALGSFASNEEAMAHFEERFDPSWMSWENQRPLTSQGQRVQRATWNIGHALPRKIFDQSDEEDLRRCWSPDNLFPQCARQNTELRDALIYTDDELLEMRHLWPVGADDDLAQLKGLFQFVDHDFIRSKQAAEAGALGPQRRLRLRRRLFGVWLSCTELRVLRVRVRCACMHGCSNARRTGRRRGRRRRRRRRTSAAARAAARAEGWAAARAAAARAAAARAAGSAAGAQAEARAEGARAAGSAAEPRVEEATVACDGPVKQRGGCRVGVRVFVRVCVQQGEWLELRTRTWIWTSGYHPNCEAFGAHEWHSFAGRVLPKGARQTE